MRLCFKPTQIHAIEVSLLSGKELKFYADTDQVAVDTEGVNLVLDDGWAVWKGRGSKKKQVGTEFVIRENIAQKRRKIRKGILKGETQVYKVTRRVFRKAKSK